MLAVVALGSICLPLRSAAAQGQIAGVVRDTSGAGIAGAEISIAGSDSRAESDEDGKFLFSRVPAGEAAIRVRRLGFTPTSASVVVRDNATAPLSIKVTEVAQALRPVVVHAQQHRTDTGYLAGFYERRDRGFGRFITGEQIQKRNPLELTDMLRMVPGLHVSSSGIGDASVRIRGNRCAPLVWIDGMPAAAAEFDIDAISPMSVAGVEIYSGIASVPANFVLPFGRTPCGTILIWSRQGERTQGKHDPVTAAQLAKMVASLQAYTADRVDEPARMDAAAPVAPVYPESLYRARVPGRVVVEFVVDTTGHAETETIGVVSATDPLFTEAVRRALADARFKPARVAGHPVPQIVRQPFTFVFPADMPGKSGARP
ncbi:MAG: TonB family protein [Gemmatimonadaceae bacterium]